MRYLWVQRGSVLVRVPNPATPQPKPGHWRITPNGKVRARPRPQQAGPIWASQLPQPFKPHTQDLCAVQAQAAAPVNGRMARSQARKVRQASNRARG